MKLDERNILIMLDCLLDTRQGTLLKINPDVAFEITSKQAYHARDNDEFVSEKYGPLSTELFKSVYEKFKQEIIFNSVKTKMYLFLQELIDGYIKMAQKLPHVGVTTIEINLHPFVFTEDQVEMIMRSMIAHIGNSAAIRIVNFDILQMSLSDVANKYESIIMYNPTEWLNSKHNDLKKGILKDTVLYLPRLNMVRALTDKEKKEISKDIQDIYKFTEMLFSGFIRIKYIPTECYCVDVPYIPHEEKTA